MQTDSRLSFVAAGVLLLGLLAVFFLPSVAGRSIFGPKMIRGEQEATCRIRAEASGELLEGAAVVVFLDGREHSQATTDKNGEFEYHFEYNDGIRRSVLDAASLRIELDGYLPWEGPLAAFHEQRFTGLKKAQREAK